MPVTMNAKNFVEAVYFVGTENFSSLSLLICIYMLNFLIYFSSACLLGFVGNLPFSTRKISMVKKAIMPIRISSRFTSHFTPPYSYRVA